uniref:Elicitin-like protein n=1 Tax=Peronospora matthiolae TaxID=2874970 RepID=A0AAV1VFQ2_9STRA
MKLAVIISAVALVANADEYDAYDAQDAHDDDHDVRPVSAVDCDVAALTPLISDPATIKCANESGYAMTALTAPTPEQSAKMCGNPACASVLQKVEVIAPHECKLMSFHLHYDLLDPLDRACDDGKPTMGHKGAAPPVTGTVTGTVTTIDPTASMNFTGAIPGNSAPPAAMTPASGANGATSTQQETTGSTGPEGTTPVVAPGPQSSETPSSVSSDTINTTSGSVSGHSGADEIDGGRRAPNGWRHHTSMKFSDGLCCPIGAGIMLKLLVAVVVVVSELLCCVDDRDSLSLNSIDPYFAAALVKGGMDDTLYGHHDADIKTLAPGGKQRTSSIDAHSSTCVRGDAAGGETEILMRRTVHQCPWRD